jgi:hypothetical protein
VGLSLSLLALIAVALTLLFPKRTLPIAASPNVPTAGASPAPAPHPSPITFNRDIAPIIFNRCSVCHHPGQAAPFPLLTYSDVHKRARTIIDALQRRYMPPWLPEPGYGDFLGDRRLTDAQIDLVKHWVDQGAVEGDASDLPPAPKFDDQWQLGRPDFIMTVPEPYRLAAEGKDVYRNLVVPIPLTANHYIKGVEFRPGNPRVVHHAFICFDETRASRKLANEQNPPGFDGMDLPPTAQMPAGQLMGWQPGKAPSFFGPGLSWLLRTNTDLVLQLHLHPSGKSETVQPSLALYFTDQPPTNAPFRIGIRSFNIDIPAGATNYTVEESYTIPVPVTLLRVSPHAHYLAKDMQGYALLPDGQKQWLLWIKNWDFNWQGDYQYAAPLELPAGARIVMRYTYDNSTNNLLNPNNPPRRVRWGLQTTDEMGEIWFQSLAHSAADRETLARDYYFYVVRRSEAHDRDLVQLDPADAEAHTRLAHNFVLEGKLAEARTHLDAAIAARPNYAPAHYELGVLLLSTNDFHAAEHELRTAIQLDPKNSEAYGNLGYVEATESKITQARADLEKALQLDPDDSAARAFLATLPSR